MKDLQTIKDEVANESGYDSWREVVETGKDWMYSDKITERYALQFKEENDRLKVEIERLKKERD